MLLSGYVGLYRRFESTGLSPWSIYLNEDEHQKGKKN